MLRLASSLLPILLLSACKDSPQKPPAPRVSTFPPLPPAPTAVVEPSGAPATFPREQPAIVVWRGGGADKPRTELSLRIWTDGSVRFRCGRRGVLPPERVSAMLDTFVSVGWDPAKEGAVPDAAQPGCIATTVQVARGGATLRRQSGCGPVPPDLTDAVEFVQGVVGPDPC